MVKYAYAERVTKKLRKLLQHNIYARTIMQGIPDVDLDENFCMRSLYWSYYGNSLYADSNEVVIELNGQKQRLLQYSDFDALLKM